MKDKNGNFSRFHINLVKKRQRERREKGAFKNSNLARERQNLAPAHV